MPRPNCQPPQKCFDGLYLDLCKCAITVASYPGPHAERGRGPGDTWQNSRTCTQMYMYVHSQHNCVIDYIPYFDTFEITRKVAVGDG